MNRIKKMNKVQTNDAAVQRGLAFLVSELEKLDPTLNQPLTSTTWARDLPVITGAGWVEYTSNLFADYGSSSDGLMTTVAGTTNDISIIQGQKEKRTYGTHTKQLMLEISYLDLMKDSALLSGPSLENLLDTGIRLANDKTLDINAYFGLEDGKYGLINNPEVPVTNVTNGNWATATPDQILEDINQAINTVWENSAFDPTALPNQILMPTNFYATLVSRKVSEAGNVSIITYLEENNVSTAQGTPLKIVPCKQCNNSGTGNAARMVVYSNEVRFVNFELCVPLYREQTQFVPHRMSYMTPYTTHIGETKYLYPETALYVEGM